MKQLFIFYTLISLIPIAHSQSQSEMNMDALKSFNVQKTEEQAILDSTLELATPEQQQKLHRLQKLHDEYVRLYTSLYFEGHTGSVRPMCASYVQANLTREHTEKLKDLSFREEGNVCSPVWMFRD